MPLWVALILWTCWALVALFYWGCVATLWLLTLLFRVGQNGWRSRQLRRRGDAAARERE